MGVQEQGQVRHGAISNSLMLEMALHLENGLGE